MLDGAFREQFIHAGPLLPLPLQVGPERRPDDIIEEERAVDKQCKAGHLQPLEGLPAKAKRDDPDEKSTTCVDSCTGGCRDGTSDGETKEVKATVEAKLEETRQLEGY